MFPDPDVEPVEEEGPVKPEPETYEEWIRAFFPHVAKCPLSDRHHRLWQWFDALTPGQKPKAHIEIWGRGGAKSTTTELGCAYAGTKLKRRFVLYVSGTQEQANLHVQSIATLLEALDVPRLLNKFGHSKGWTQDRLRTESGFNVAAYGLDAALRGIKLDEFRPDLIIFDDIDDREDSRKTIKKKLDAMRKSIIPAGSPDCAVLFVQNLIHPESIASQLYKGTAKFLMRRDPVQIDVAVRGLQTDLIELPNGSSEYRITGGEATWEGQSLEICEAQINEWGLEAFLEEAQHEVEGVGGLFFNTSALETITPEDFLKLIEQGYKFRYCRAWDLAATLGGGDFTAGILMARAPNGVVYILDVKHYQLDSNNARALVEETARRDAAGEVYRADEYDPKTGEILKKGDLYFTFKRGPAKVRLHLPQDPGQAGKDQAQQLRALLKKIEGVEVTIQPVNGKKPVRARGIAERMNSRNVKLVHGSWNHEFKEEYRLFREDETHEFDDMVDAGADAYNDLESVMRRSGDDAKAFRIRIGS